MYALTWDNSSITWSIRIWNAVAILDPSCLPCEEHLHIKYDMTSWLRACPYSKILKYTKTWYIPFAMAFSLLASNSLECSIDTGTSILNLWIFFITPYFTAAMVLSLFLRVNCTYHEYAGPSKITFATTHNATSTGLNFFIIFRGIQVLVDSFHWVRNDYPVAVFLSFLTPLLVVMKALV